MNVFQHIAHRMGLATMQEVRAARRQGIQYARRSFEGAQLNRLTLDLSTAETQIDSEIQAGGKPLRARARLLSLNNQYVRRFIQLFIANVVGPLGHTFQSNVTEIKLQQKKWTRVPDKLANSKITESFLDWQRAEHCSSNGRYTYPTLQKLIATYYARDGEAFIRRVYDASSKYLLKLEVLPPEAVDETYNAVLDGGNVIVMGVEIDKWRRPVAYHVKKVVPEYQIYGYSAYGVERVRVPASEMIHWFDPEYCNQTRGFTRIASTMLPLHWIKGYESSAVTNARLSAGKMGFFGDEKGEEVDEFQGDGQTENEDDEKIDTVIDASPGTFTDIGSKKFYGFDPTYPTQQHEMFLRSTLRGIASGLGLAYSSMTNDYGSANYSSLRAELLVERRMWLNEQQKMVDDVQKKIFAWWLEAALGGVVNLPMSKFEKLNQPVFTGPRWAWVDPERDVRSVRMELESLLTSPFDVAAERGYDLEEMYRDIAEARAMAADYGLEAVYETKNLSPLAPDQPAAPPAQNAPPGRSEPDIAGALARPGNGNGKH